MKKRIIAFVLFITTAVSAGFMGYAQDADFSKWSPWSFYITGSAKSAEFGKEYLDVSDPDECVPVLPSYRSSNNVQPGLLASPGEDRTYMYIRPEYEWDVKIAEHIRERASFYMKSSEGFAVGFTVPEDGVYNIYANVINDYGNENPPQDAVMDGGMARVSLLCGGETNESEENSEMFLLPPGNIGSLDEAVYEKSGVELSKDDKIFLRISGGENPGDVFQAIWRIEKTDGEETEKIYDIRDLVDNAGEDVSDGIWNVIDGSVKEYDEDAAEAAEDDSYARLLAGLGIIAESEIGSYLLRKEITRAEFAFLIARLLNYDDSVMEYEESEYFTDVKNDDNPYMIDALVREGIIEKARRFRPGDAITLDEALTMAVNALGYKEYAKAFGGYPEGYRKQADILDIVPKDSTDALLRNRALEMIANMTGVYVLDIDSIAGGEAILNNHRKETILSKRHDIYYGEGIVTKVPYGTLVKGSPGRENKIWIGEEEYDTFIDVDDKLGHKVGFYYLKAEDAETLLYLIPEKREKKLVLDAENIEKIDYTGIEYYENERVKYIKIDRYADYLYNSNAAALSGDLKELMNRDSKVEVIDRGGDGLFDVINIKTYKNYIAEFINKEDNEIIEKLTQSTISLEDAGITAFEYPDGSKASFNDISEGAVISVFSTPDNSVMRVIISTESVQGIVGGRRQEKGNIYYTIGTESYRVADNYYEISAGELEIGVKTVIYLDAFGALAYAKSNISDRFGYLMKVSSDDGDIDTLLFKIVTSSGETVSFKASARIEYNGEKISGYEIYERISNEYLDESYKGIIQYKASEGRLKKITMPDNLNSIYYSDTMKYHSGTGILGGKMAVDENTLVFQIPDEAGKSRGVQPTVQSAKSYFVHFASYSGLTAVRLDKDDVVADAVLMIGSKSKALDQYQYPFLVKNLSTYIDENDEECLSVTGYRNGQLVTYETETSATLKGVSAYTKTPAEGTYDVDVGDIILTTLDGETITYAEIDFDASTKTKLGPNPYTDYFGRPRLYYAGVYQKIGKYLKVAADPASVSDPSSLEVQGINKIYIIDLKQKKDKIKEGSYADIVPYKSGSSSAEGGNDGYTMAVFSTMEKPDAIYIYI